MLKKLRLENNLTQAKLSKMLNVKQGTVSMWERGKTKPPLTKIYALARALNVSVGEIVSCLLDDKEA